MFNLVNFFENDLKLIFPELFLLIFISFLILFLVIIGNSKVFKLPIILPTAIYLVLFGFFLVLLLYNNLISMECYLFNFQFQNDQFIIFIKYLILISVSCYLFSSLDFLKFEGIRSYEYVLLILLSIFGMVLLISSYDFISIYLALELQSLCLYILASYDKNSYFSTEAGLKYFILGAFASGLLLFGFTILYGLTGMTNLDDLLHFLYYLEVDNFLFNGIILGLMFVSVAFLFKLGAAPFHMWLPDVYEGASLIVTFFFAVVPKIVIIGFMLKFYIIIFGLFNFCWSILFMYCAFFSLLIGSLGALYQTKLKRLVAYSAIGNVGFLLFGLGCNSIEGIHGVILYLIFYLVNLISLFCILLILRRFSSNFNIVNIYDLSSLKESNILLAFFMSLFLFSMAGIPPLAGFYGKFYIFLALVNSKFYLLALIGVLFSVISSFYYIRLIKLLFFNSIISFFFYKNFVFKNLFFIIYFGLFNIFFFIYPSFILEYTYQLALNFFF